MTAGLLIGYLKRVPGWHSRGNPGWIGDGGGPVRPFGAGFPGQLTGPYSLPVEGWPVLQNTRISAQITVRAPRKKFWDHTFERLAWTGSLPACHILDPFTGGPSEPTSGYKALGKNHCARWDAALNCRRFESGRARYGGTL